jgi:hypothetical protein
MRISLFGLAMLFGGGCAVAPADSPVSEDQAAVTAQSVPTGTGSFQGQYVVPVPTNLTAAATFAMTEVNWTVTAGAVTLHYDLPTGLVGGDVPVTLTGSMAAGATTVHLTGTVGAGICTASGTVVSCSEVFGDLGALPISMTVVQQTAQTDNQPVSNRVAVAQIFPSDPIGTVSFDITKPSPDDHGGGHGGGGGGRGPH